LCVKRLYCNTCGSLRPAHLYGPIMSYQLFRTARPCVHSHIRVFRPHGSVARMHARAGNCLLIVWLFFVTESLRIVGVLLNKGAEEGERERVRKKKRVRGREGGIRCAHIGFGVFIYLC